MKKVFGLISGFPDEEIHRKQRLERLNKTFAHLIDLFGEDIEFLIIAQNGQDYQVPDFIKNTLIYKFDKLGILGARKMLREKFLESEYDYLIMCDDDIVLESKVDNAAQKYLKELDKHPEGFSFLKYGGTLTFCAISKGIYEKIPMVDVDPEKNEGYEDMVFPLLLHYKYPDKEFTTGQFFTFLQNTKEYKVDHKSTGMMQGIKYNELQLKTDIYTKHFKRGEFNIAKIKHEIELEGNQRGNNPDNTYVGNKNSYLYF